MSKPFHTLAELIDSIDRRLLLERDRLPDEGGPRLRLKDWKVLEMVSVGPADYVILRRVRVEKRAFDSLAARELDAVRHACAGATNKEIAYQMGIHPSTVGVLLWRASRKIGAASRDDMIEMFATWQLRASQP